jgi:hypothetical protein
MLASINWGLMGWIVAAAVAAAIALGWVWDRIK